MKMNPHRFNAFAQVVRAGSFSGAARALGVTQSAVTQHVSNLEAEVGAQLVQRRAQGVELTHAGRDLYDLAERHAALTQEIDEKLAGYSSFQHGQLDIIANAPQPALSSIAAFGALYPQIEINFTLYDWTRASAMLANHEVDLAFITRPRMREDCHYKKVSDTAYVLYVPLGHPLAGRAEVSLGELSGETLILPERGSLTQKVVSEAMARHGARARRQVTMTTFPVMKEAILHGVGVGIFLANAAPPHERLIGVPIRELPERFEIFAAVPRYKIGLRLIKSFWDELVVEPAAAQT